MALTATGYFFLQEATVAAQMVSEDPGRVRIDGGSRVLLVVSVEDADAAYEQLKAKCRMRTCLVK